MVSERFELGRNFCNKLWNAARFALLNLEGYQPAPVADDELAVEDRWILSRLATVTRQTTEALEAYRYADAARVLYDFAWNEFCSFYVEMVKSRLQAEATRPLAQRVLAHALDVLLRLLHPVVPFVTEEVWQALGHAAPRRGLEALEQPAESIMIAPWPQPDAQRYDGEIEARFGLFQEVLRVLRDVRSRHNLPPKAPMPFSVRSDAAAAALLRPMEPYFATMAGARAVAWGPDVRGSATSPGVMAAGLEVFVDLSDYLDLGAELGRAEKERKRLEGAIASKERQLANTSFVSRAPPK